MLPDPEGAALHAQSAPLTVAKAPRMPVALLLVAVVMPLMADCATAGQSKIDRAAGVRLIVPTLNANELAVPAAVKTIAELPCFTVRPPNCWLLVALVFPWIARMPPPKASEELLATLLMMFAAGSRLAEIQQKRAAGNGRAARIGAAATKGRCAAADLD